MLTIAMASTQDPPPNPSANSHRVGDIMTSLGDALKTAVSSRDNKYCHLWLMWWVLSFSQTKKGQNSLHVATVNKLVTDWLVDIKKRGLATNKEVHMAAPTGIMEYELFIFSITYCALPSQLLCLHL